MLVRYGKWLNGRLQGALWTVVFFMAPLVSASRAEASSLSAQDRSFFEDAALATSSEIEFGKIAMKKAVDPQVRAFASRNFTDYSRLQEALSGVAAAHQAELPTGLRGEALRDYRRLIERPAPSFDRLYVYMMFKWHAVAARGYQEAASKVSEPKLRAWTEQSLPIIQDHFEAIQRIAIAKGIPMNSGDDQRTVPKY
jgi:putative membrane protein